MKNAIVLGMVFFMALTAWGRGPAWGGEDCGDLEVSIECLDWSYRGNPSCKKGGVLLPVEKGGTQAVMDQSEGVLPCTGHGPDCTVTFENNRSSQYATYRVQQNYCCAGAGDITVEHKEGVRLQFHTNKGSYGESYSGEVHFFCP